MNEAELEQLAIKELMREAEIHSSNSTKLEPKINKTVKPNNKFLCSTIKSVMAHNKREHERTQKNCQEKLKMLEYRRSRKLRKQQHNIGNTKNSASSNELMSSSSETDVELIVPEESKNSRKRHSFQHTKKSPKRTRTIKRPEKSDTFQSAATTMKEMESQRVQYEREEYYAKHFQKLAAFALASESYHQVGKWLCYQALLAGSCESYEQDYDLHYDCLTLNDIEVLEPIDSPTTMKDSIINLSSDDEMKDAALKEELDLESCLAEFHSPVVEFETIQLVDNCISLDSDEDEQKGSRNSQPDEEACQLINEELNDSDEEAMQTIELSDSSDNEDTRPVLHANGSIDLTSD